MAHQPDWSSPAGGLVASALGADEHDHLSSSVVITHQGQRPTAPLTHSVSLRVHYVHAHNRLFFALSFTSHIYHLNVWQISKLKFKMWDHICCGFTTKPTCPCSTHLITLLCWQQPVMGVLCFWLLWPADFHEKKGYWRNFEFDTHNHRASWVSWLYLGGQNPKFRPLRAQEVCSSDNKTWQKCPIG